MNFLLDQDVYTSTARFLDRLGHDVIQGVSPIVCRHRTRWSPAQKTALIDPLSIQIIERNGKPEWAVIPYETYLQMVEQVETLQDIRDYDAVKSALERGEEELVPSEVVYALVDGENPIKVWREFRSLTQLQLAEAVGISVPYLSQLESGKRKGSMEVLAAIARTLKLSLDDIVN